MWRFTASKSAAIETRPRSIPSCRAGGGANGMSIATGSPETQSTICRSWPTRRSRTRYERFVVGSCTSTRLIDAVYPALPRTAIGAADELDLRARPRLRCRLGDVGQERPGCDDLLHLVGGEGAHRRRSHVAAHRVLDQRSHQELVVRRVDHDDDVVDALREVDAVVSHAALFERRLHGVRALGEAVHRFHALIGGAHEDDVAGHAGAVAFLPRQDRSYRLA